MFLRKNYGICKIPFRSRVARHKTPPELRIVERCGRFTSGKWGAEILFRHFPNDGNDRREAYDDADYERAAPQPPFQMLLCGCDDGKRIQADCGDSFADFGVIVEHVR